MARQSAMMSRLRDVAFAARLFLGVAVIALFASVGVLAYHQGAFKHIVKVYFYAGSASGMNKGMAVKLAGFNVGSLERFDIDGGLRVKVGLKVDARYKDLIDEDATVRLVRENIIGPAVLEVWPGNGDTGPIREGSVLRYEREPSIDTAVNMLLGQIAPVMDEARQLGRYLNDAQGDFRQTVRHLNHTVAVLADASGGLQQLLAQTSSRIDATSTRAQAALESTDALINEARTTLATVDSSARKIDAALPGIAMKLDQSLDGIREASAAAIGLLTNEMVTLVSDSGDLISSTREVMGDVKRSWPLREMVEKPRERMLKLDSGGGLLAVPVDPARAP